MTKHNRPGLRTALAGVVFTALAFCATATTARADTIVFNNGFDTGSQQNFVLGMDFNVLSSVWVTQLGAFDSFGDGFDGTVTVGIYDLSNSTLVAPAVQLSGLAGTLVGGSRFVSITPFTLGPGSYSIVASGFTGGNWSGNTGFGDVTSFNGNGQLTIVPGGGRWNNGNTFQLPTAYSGGYTQGDPVFQAGTFAVPDGGSAAALLGLGLLAVGWARRRL